MVSKDKTDIDLGTRVRDFLIEKGVETPIVSYIGDKSLIESHFREIMKNLGLDLSDDSLRESPKRVSKMFVDEIFYGLDYRNFPKCTAIENKMDYQSMVIERDISAISTCEHHFVVIDGVCHIGYVPKNKVVGLSKLNRIVEFFCKRPQVQERLTEQVYYALSLILETEDIGVVVDSKHFCVKTRGIRDINSSTVTSKMGGVFYTDLSCRQEFLDLIKLKR